MNVDGVTVIELTPGPLAHLGSERAAQLLGALEAAAVQRPRALLVLAPDGVGVDEPRVPTPRGLLDPAALLAAFPAPTVAVWNGPAVGAGAELVLAADIRVIGSVTMQSQPQMDDDERRWKRTFVCVCPTNERSPNGEHTSTPPRGCSGPVFHGRLWSFICGNVLCHCIDSI